VKIDADALLGHTFEIDAPPAHDAVPLAIRAGLDILASPASYAADKHDFGPSVQ
jgi:hypothetical protein